MDGTGGARRLPGWASAGLVFGALGALLWLERRRPLRRAVEPRWRRDARNLAVAAVSGAALRIVEKPVVEPLAQMAERRRWGLLKRLDWRLPDGRAPERNPPSASPVAPEGDGVFPTRHHQQPRSTR